MTDNSIEQFQVTNDIDVLNENIQKARYVAISSMKPIYQKNDKKLAGFRIEVEGPKNHISYFGRLLRQANLIG